MTRMLLPQTRRDFVELRTELLAAIRHYKRAVSEYRQHLDNALFLQGIIDIADDAEQLKHSPALSHRVYCCGSQICHLMGMYYYRIV